MAAMSYFRALYGACLRLWYAFQAALRAVGAAGGGWAVVAALRAIGADLGVFRAERLGGPTSCFFCWTFMTSEQTLFGAGFAILRHRKPNGDF